MIGQRQRMFAHVARLLSIRLLNDPTTGSPYKAMQVWKYRPALLCKRLIFHHVLPEAIIYN
jgi:hypothetical protein